jgi:hypothetical protein
MLCMIAALLRRGVRLGFGTGGWGAPALGLALGLTVSALAGCRSQVGGVREAKAETPAAYTENRVYYVAPKPPPGVAGHDESRRRLYQPFELARVEAEWQRVMQGSAGEAPAEASSQADAQPDAQPEAKPNGQPDARATVDTGAVAHGDPLSIIVHGVRIPDSITSDVGPGPYDIAVILDVMSGTSGGEANSLVVWYQTGVPAGQMLNFRDLLVYADPAWDSAFAPYFRIRVLDVRDITMTDTTLTRSLRSIGSLAASFAGIVPSPVMPGVSIAMDAATQVLERPSRRVLMDFAVQFYSQEQRRQAGGDLGQLRKGSWMVLGRPEQAVARASALMPEAVEGAPQEPASGVTRSAVPSDFWRRTLFVDQQTGQIHDTQGGLMNVPYVQVTVSTAMSQVPSIVVRRSDELIRLLSTAEGRANTTDLENQSRQLTSSVMAYVAERRLMRNRSVADVENIMNTFARHLSAKDKPEAFPGDVLSNESERQLLLLVNRLVPGRTFASAQTAYAWWSGLSTSTKSKIDIVEDPRAPLGFRIEVPK